MLLSLLRPDLRNGFTPYSSAASEMGKIEGASYLNANENPYPFDGLEGLERYDVQQPPALLAALSKAYGTMPNQIVITRGSDESIDLLIRMFCTAGEDNILICPPTFGMYTVYANFQGAGTITAPMIERNGTYRLDTESVIATALNPANRIKLVFLCNPAAPTGTWLNPEDISSICTALEGRCAVIIDEAYIDFTTHESFLGTLKNHPNALILRTMSKIHALAGERIGATLSLDTAFLTFMRGCLAPYPVPKSVAKNAVEALAQAQHKQEKIVKIIAEQREKLESAFSASELVAHVYPSVANFLLVQFKDYETAQNLFKKALAANIILRDMSSKPDTKNCLRLSVGTEETNQRLIGLLN